MNERQYNKHIREARRLNELEYFKKSNFDPKDLIQSAFVLLADKGIEYNPNTFYKAMWNVLSHRHYDFIKSHPRYWKLYLERNGRNKARYRINVTDWYVKHLLSKKYSIEYINNNPDLIEQKRQEILNLRKNGNKPIDNQIPELPDELFDLSLVEEEYKGYAITAQGELYSCKALYKTDVAFTNNWYPLAKRKNGCVRLNIKGAKKEIGTKTLLQRLPNYFHLVNN